MIVEEVKDSTPKEKAQVVERTSLPRSLPYTQQLVGVDPHSKAGAEIKSHLREQLGTKPFESLMKLQAELELPLVDLIRTLGKENFDRLIELIKLDAIGEDFLAVNKKETALSVVTTIHEVLVIALSVGGIIYEALFPQQENSVKIPGEIEYLIKQINVKLSLLKDKIGVRENMDSGLDSEIKKLLACKDASSLVLAIRHIVKIIELLNWKEQDTRRDALIEAINNIRKKLGSENFLDISPEAKVDTIVQIATAKEQKAPADKERVQEMHFCSWFGKHTGSIFKEFSLKFILNSGANFAFFTAARIIGELVRPGVVAGWLADDANRVKEISIIGSLAVCLSSMQVILYYYKNRRGIYLTARENDVRELAKKLLL